MKPGPFHLGLIGFPLGHSRSPQLHHAALRHYGLEGEYTLFPVPPLPEGDAQIQALLYRLRKGELHGLNVTIPHKPSVMPYVDLLTPVAQAVGAVNTLYLDPGLNLVGDNTDVPGFLQDLHQLPGLDVGLALVLGAGGSARAVVYALLQEAWRVRLLARHPEQAVQIAAQMMALPASHAYDLQCASLDADGIAGCVEGCRLVVNTTPVGMFPNPDGSPWPDDVPWPQRAAVYDLVYNPPQTTFTRSAQAAGLPVRTGGGMLSSQAALAFSRWTNLEPPFEIMYKEIS